MNQPAASHWSMAAVYTYLSPHWLGPKPDQISVGGYNRRGVFWFGLLYWHSLVFIIALRPKTRPSKSFYFCFLEKFLLMESNLLLYELEQAPLYKALGVVRR